MTACPGDMLQVVYVKEHGQCMSLCHVMVMCLGQLDVDNVMAYYMCYDIMCAGVDGHACPRRSQPLAHGAQCSKRFTIHHCWRAVSRMLNYIVVMHHIWTSCTRRY